MSDTITIHIPGKKVAFILGIIAFVLCIMSISLKALEWEVGVNSTYWIYHTVQLFNVNREGNIPTFFSALILLSAAILLLLIAHITRLQQGRYVWAWWLLGFVFLYLTVDESAALHEKFTIYLQEKYPESTQGHFHFAWVLVGIPFAGLMALIFFRFWWHLPHRTRLLFFIAGSLYVGGALGVELIGANQWYLNEGTSLKFSAIGTFEEFCEMQGIVVLIYALLTYLQTLIDKVEIILNQPSNHNWT